MADRAAEFLIDDVVRGEDDRLRGPYAVLIGRCGDAPIRRGEVFQAVYRYRPGRYPVDMGEPPARLETVPVRLTVAEIQTLTRSLELLSQGMTGAVFVQGEGLDRLGQGWVVGQPVAAPPGANGSAPSEGAADPAPTRSPSANRGTPEYGEGV